MLFRSIFKEIYKTRSPNRRTPSPSPQPLGSSWPGKWVCLWASLTPAAHGPSKWHNHTAWNPLPPLTRHTGCPRWSCSCLTPVFSDARRRGRVPAAKRTECFLCAPDTGGQAHAPASALPLTVWSTSLSPVPWRDSFHAPELSHLVAVRSPKACSPRGG